MQRISVEESILITNDASWKPIHSLGLSLSQFMTLTQKRNREGP